MSTENQVISVVLIYTLIQFELHLQADIGLHWSVLQYWEAIVHFNLETCVQMVYLLSQNAHELIQICKSAILVPLLAQIWDSLLSLKRCGLYSSILQEDQYTSWLYTFIHWGYLGPSRHPPFFLSYKLSWILQSSETTCRWFLILVASTQWLSWCVWDRKSHTSLIHWAWASDGFLSSPEHATLERKQLSSWGAFVGRNETGNTGHSGEIFIDRHPAVGV